MTLAFFYEILRFTLETLGVQKYVTIVFQKIWQYLQIKLLRLIKQYSKYPPKTHCVKSVVFGVILVRISRTRTEYGEIQKDKQTHGSCHNVVTEDWSYQRYQFAVNESFADVI